jgi:hypothetical protein
MHIIKTSANCSPAVEIRHTEYDVAFQVPALLGSLPLDHVPRASLTRHESIDMVVEPEEGEKLVHERLQSALPVRAKTRRQTIRWNPRAALPEQPWPAPNGHFYFTGTEAVNCEENLTQNPKKSTRIVSFPEKGPGDARSANFKKFADLNTCFFVDVLMCFLYAPRICNYNNTHLLQ